jgi:hypothetical protein
LSGQFAVIGRTAPRHLAAATILALLLAALPGAASAHEGVARLILEPEHVNPGGVVTVRGEDLLADDEMTITLIASSGRTELTTVTSDGEGHFTVSIQLSPDAAQGVYAVEAAGQVMLTVPLFVEGAPVSDGDGAPPGQDEGLPAVIPSFAVGASQAPGATVQPRPVVTETSVDIVPFIALFAAIAALGFLVWRTRRPPVPRDPDLA